ncbi:MAG: hypothetical protein V4581_01185 [Bacteroidota bacterium]
MIQELKNIPPYIDFGFGITQTQAAISQEITVWLNTLYNQDAYTFTLNALEATVTKISNYEYQVTYTTLGTYQLSLSVVSTDKTISLDSNILSITIT